MGRRTPGEVDTDARPADVCVRQRKHIGESRKEEKADGARAARLIEPLKCE